MPQGSMQNISNIFIALKIQNIGQNFELFSRGIENQNF